MKQNQDDVNEELRLFMEKHGKSLDNRENLDEEKLKNIFYNEDMI